MPFPPDSAKRIEAPFYLLFCFFLPTKCRKKKRKKKKKVRYRCLEQTLGFRAYSVAMSLSHWFASGGPPWHPVGELKTCGA